MVKEERFEKVVKNTTDVSLWIVASALVSLLFFVLSLGDETMWGKIILSFLSGCLFTNTIYLIAIQLCSREVYWRRIR